MRNETMDEIWVTTLLKRVGSLLIGGMDLVKAI